MLIGIDVGGTHTDGVCIRDGRVEAMAKVPTDHDNLLATITEACGVRALEAGSYEAILWSRK